MILIRRVLQRGDTYCFSFSSLFLFCPLERRGNALRRCVVLSHSLEGLYEKSQCSVLLDVGKAFRTETEPDGLCAVSGGSAGPGLFPTPVGASVLVMGSIYIKKEFPKGYFLVKSGFQVWFSSPKFRIQT